MFKWHLTRSLLTDDYVLVTVLLFANFRFCVYNNMICFQIQGSSFSSKFKTTTKWHNVLYSAFNMNILRNWTCGTPVNWICCYLARFISFFWIDIGMHSDVQLLLQNQLKALVALDEWAEECTIISILFSFASHSIIIFSFSFHCFTFHLITMQRIIQLKLNKQIFGCLYYFRMFRCIVLIRK